MPRHEVGISSSCAWRDAPGFIILGTHVVYARPLRRELAEETNPNSSNIFSEVLLGCIQSMPLRTTIGKRTHARAKQKRPDPYIRSYDTSVGHTCLQNWIKSPTPEHISLQCLPVLHARAPNSRNCHECSLHEGSTRIRSNWG